MLRRGGKRIRMDDPPDDYEPPFTPYSVQPQTPMDVQGYFFHSVFLEAQAPTKFPLLHRNNMYGGHFGQYQETSANQYADPGQSTSTVVDYGPSCSQAQPSLGVFNPSIADESTAMFVGNRGGRTTRSTRNRGGCFVHTQQMVYLLKILKLFINSWD